MSAFDERWKRCTEQARQAAEPPAKELSDAFVTRVLARAFERQSASLEAVWIALGWRTLAVVAVLLVSSYVVDLRAEPDSPPDTQVDRPAVEDVVADEFWML